MGGEGREGKGASGVWVHSQGLPTSTGLAKGTMEFKGRLRRLLRKPRAGIGIYLFCFRIRWRFQDFWTRVPKSRGPMEMGV